MPDKKNLPETTTLKSEVVEKLLEVQSKEIDLRAQEVEIRGKELEVQKSEIAHNQDIAKESISAQLEDSKLKQEFFLKANLRKTILTGIVIVGAFGFLFYAMHNDQTTFAERVVDLIVGAIGCYFAGKATSKKENNNGSE